jgi:hypothetical protein
MRKWREPIRLRMAFKTDDENLLARGFSRPRHLCWKRAASGYDAKGRVHDR